jgi:mono/diheme cytochrome c family protein
MGLLFCGGALAEESPMPLKPGPGADVTSANCNVCHTSNYIVMNSMFLAPDAWRAEVAKMRLAFGAPIDDTTAAEITAYLAEHYAVAAKP